MKTGCSGIFYILAKLAATPANWESAGLPGDVVKQDFVLTTNKPGTTTIPISIVVTPPSGGQASDITLQTTSVDIKQGDTLVPVLFKLATGAVLSDPTLPNPLGYAVAITFGS